MQGHVIVCGMGQVGYRIVTLLRRLGEPVAVITQATRNDWVRDARASGVEVLMGDGRDAQLLCEAGVDGARALIAATDHDPVNIEIALDVKRMRPDLPVVVRLFDQTLAHQLESTFDIRRALGMQTLAAPAFAAAAMGDEVVGAFTADEGIFVVGRFTLDGASRLAGRTVRQVAAEHRVAPFACESHSGGWSLGLDCDRPLGVSDRVAVVGRMSDWNRLAHEPGAASRRARTWAHVLKRYLHPSPVLEFVRDVWRHAPLALRIAFLVFNLLIASSVFVFQIGMDLNFVDALYFIVATVTTTGYGDITPRNASDGLKLYGVLLMFLGSATIATLYSLITDFIVTERFEQVLGRHRVPQEGHVIVVGLGGLGCRIAEELHRSHTPAAAIERDPNGEFVEAVRARAPVIIGDGRTADTLLKAGVERARALITVTDDDAVNLGVGLAAKQMSGSLRTVVRLFDADFARKAQSTLILDAALSAPLIAAPTFVAAALYSDVLDAFVLDSRLVVLLERLVGDEWAGWTPARLRTERGVVLLMRRRLAECAYSLAGDEDEPLTKDEKVLVATWRPLSQSNTE